MIKQERDDETTGAIPSLTHQLNDVEAWKLTLPTFFLCYISDKCCGVEVLA